MLSFNYLRVQVTNDGATILNLLEVEHPAGKVLVELAQLQVHIVATTHTNSFVSHSKFECRDVLSCGAPCLMPG